MPTVRSTPATLRAYRNSRLYRPLMRISRIYHREIVERMHEEFPDFQPAFPSMLSNLDVAGTPVSVLAARAGVTRQAAGQLLRAIERSGFVRLAGSKEDARVTLVRFTAKGTKMLARVFVLVEEIEGRYAALLKPGEFERVRAAMQTIAEAIDPGGVFGVGDA
ncbi:MAG TPA: MarR family winged helix-turn-helix transcriptional regulator [Gemmatimonadaceae bacterium]|nr:MarR family winged helix-turn-helix transcriptional regulator [Gemmatimonadaceae bacterium]